MSEFVVIFTGLVLLLLDAFLPKLSKGTLAYIGIAGCLLAIAFNRPQEIDASSLYQVDSLAVFIKNILLITTAGVLLFSISYQNTLRSFLSGEKSTIGVGEYFVLPLFLCAGMMWIASAADLILLFVAIELTTVGFYIQVSAARRNKGSVEAGTKYLVLGALTTAVLVYGIAWLYGASGSTSFAALQEFALTEQAASPATLFGLGLLLLALSFKVGAAPAHSWIPDVYQGAPTPTTTFLSIASKTAGIAAILRIFTPFLVPESPTKTLLSSTLLILAIVTLLIGNLGAIRQTNIKRLMGYSSIGHAGFLLLILACPTEDISQTINGVGLYLAAYMLMNLAFFGVLIAVRSQKGHEEIHALRGLLYQHPALGIVCLISLASLAGVPLTIGFLGKFFAIFMAVNAQQWWGLAAAIVAGVAGFYYYLKMALEVVSKAEQSSTNTSTSTTWKLNPALVITLCILAIAIILYSFAANELTLISPTSLALEAQKN